MAKGGKARRGPKRASSTRGKAKAPAGKRGAKKKEIAWYGPFTRYVHSIRNAEAIEKFKADRSAHISLHERLHRVTFTAKQRGALISGKATEIDACIDAEASSPQPMVMHGGTVTHVGGGGWP